MPPCGQCNSGTAETASVLYLTHPVLSRPFLRFLKNFPAAACGLQTLNMHSWRWPVRAGGVLTEALSKLSAGRLRRGASWRDKKGAPGGIQFKVPTGLSINQTQPDVSQSPPCGFLQNCPAHRRETIDKAPEMGYSKDTKGAASRTAPPTSQRSNRDFGRVAVTSLCYSGEPD